MRASKDSSYLVAPEDLGVGAGDFGPPQVNVFVAFGGEIGVEWDVLFATTRNVVVSIEIPRHSRRAEAGAQGQEQGEQAMG